MLNYIVISDIHLGLSSNSDYFLTRCELLFDDIRDYAIKHKIKYLIIAGDLYHTRKSLNQKVIDTSLQIMHNLKNVFEKIYIIAGNHDLYFNESMEICSLSLFYGMDHVKVIKEPYYLDNITLLPWLFNKEILKNKEQNDILIGHFEINGITLNASGTIAEGYNLNLSDFSDFNLVLSGHFHKPGKYGNIVYLGSPFQHNFNDIGSINGFYELNSENCDLKFIEFTKSAKHYRIKDTDDFTDVKGNVIELYFTDDYGIEKNKEIIKKFSDLKPYKLITKYFNKDLSIKNDEDEDVIIGDKLEMLKKYYDNIDLTKGINKKLILKLIDNIYKEIE
jgi:DNA repair exonuclease SbcCD nuclease subunit